MQGLDEDSEVVKELTALGAPRDQAMGLARQLPVYWGDKQFTSGPWYFGAVVLFFFVLALFIVKGRLKWWLLSATLLSVFLSFGRHFPLISDLFFDYFPMYNNFRAVESNLVIASFLVPILAILGINELVTNGPSIQKLNKKVFYTTGILCGI
jgi:hypothetical protein